ncbi:hypothetical protein EB796_004590 [Bugula neritina]|uniref:Uncharacterized protein n=1 Tax=Bugula neritina TaxID=10212 RepID=A0A7J7KGT6_BUGNE|nr:hypothetical protein EB796_004590 [Bugula neritina]
MNCKFAILVLLLSLISGVCASKFEGCISSKCCPGQQEMYPGDHVTLTLEKGRNDSGSGVVMSLLYV